MKKRIKPTEVENINSIIINSLEFKVGDSHLNELKGAFYFKGRKSVGISNSIISKMINQDESVLDPFVGGGSFILASMLANRKVVGVELDNYTYFALNMIFQKCNLEKLNLLFNNIKKQCKIKILNLYKTECCGHENYIKKLLFDPVNQEYFNPIPNREIQEGRNIHLLKTCPVCKKNSKKFDNHDYQKILETELLDTSKFPNDELIENSRINITASTGSNFYGRFFNNRAKFALLKIQENISILDDCIEKDMLQHVLVNTLPLAKIAMYGSSTDILYHVIQEKGQEMNVWYLFEEKFNNFIKFKKNNSHLIDVARNKMELINGDYYSVLNGKHDDYDLIYTDFPYTDQVPYIERNQLYRIWLYNFMDKEKFKLSDYILDNEIVQTNAVKRENKHSLESYYHSLDRMFNCFYNILKENKYVFLTIKLGANKYIQTYSEIINLARKNGFEYVTRIGIESTNPTLRKQSAYANTLQKEQIVAFKKLDDKSRYFYIKDNNLEVDIVSKIYSMILKEDDVVLSQCLSIVITYIREKYQYIVNQIEIEKINSLIKRNFIVTEDQILRLDNDVFYVNIEDEQTTFIKLYDLIPICIRELLEKRSYFEIEDLYLKLTSILCESNHSTLSNILDNKKHNKEVLELLNSYCEITNGVYTKKHYENVAFEGSKDISQFSGAEFEALTKNLLDKEGFFNIFVKGGAGDRGVDIIASKLINKETKRYYIQCKRWVAKVGSEPMQRLFAEKVKNNIDYTICITTSDFTSDGKEAANDFNVEMWNGVKVMELLNKHFPKKYFNALLPN